MLPDIFPLYTERINEYVFASPGSVNLDLAQYSLLFHLLSAEGYTAPEQATSYAG